MNLPDAPAAYNQTDQGQTRRALEDADAKNHKKGADLRLGYVKQSDGTLRPEQIIVYGTDDNAAYALSVTAGALVVTAL